MPGRQVANSILDKEESKKYASESIINVLTFLGGDARWRDVNFKVQARNIAGSGLIWGNATLGEWNAFNWGAQASFSFILGSTVAGILGTSQLGQNVSNWVTFASSSAEQNITQAGIVNILEWLNNQTGNNPTHGAIGSGSTAYNDSQTALVSELDWGRSNSTYALSDKKIEITTAFNSLVSGNASEAGLFDNATSGSGDMFTRRVFTEQTKTNTEEWRFITTLSGSNEVPIMDSGINAMRDYFASGSAVGNPEFMSWGSGSNVIATTDTSMENIFQTNSTTNTNTTTKVNITGVLTPAQATGNTINRIGIWSASGSGTLFMHTAIPQIAKDDTFQVQSIGELRMN